MRNLKRVLSLGMTAAMISSLMVVSSSAASYKDVTSEDNTEAIEVLKAVNIMVGDDNGNFNPDSKVTRNEMAVVMSNLMAYNAATYKNTSPFTDVPSWAEPYVAACYTNGITAGYTATTYGGSDNVTTAQAALMLMKALGYFQYQRDFGSDWQLSTVAQGNKIDLFDDVDAGVREAMTRNDLAQLVLNTLESGTVDAETDGDFTVGGVTVTSSVKYNYITSNKDYAYAIDDKTTTNNDGTKASGAIVELGEKLFDGDLTKEETTDDFGRPSNQWEYQAKEIGNYADDYDTMFTAKVTSKALYDAAGKTAAENYKWTVSVDGEKVTSFSSDKLVNWKSEDDTDFNAKQGGDKLTGNGVITEVFVDGTKKTVDVAVIHQYAAEVLKVDEDDGTITLSDLSQDGPADTKDEYDTTDFAEDDIVIYTYANDEIQSVYAATKVDGDVESVRVKTKDSNSQGDKNAVDEGDNFQVDGTTYKYNYTMKTGDMLTDDNVNNGVVAYTDAQGYVAYVDESAVTYDYAYVLSMGSDNERYDDTKRGSTVYARLVLTDGTMIKVETDNDYDDIAKLKNHIVSYSKDKNNVYSLTDRSDGYASAKATGLNIDNDKAGMTLVDSDASGKHSAVANANTVFIVADSDPDDYDDYDFTVYTGVKNVPDIDGEGGSTAITSDDTKAVVALKDNSNVAKVVYIEDADVSGNNDVSFAKAKTNAKYTKNSDGDKIFEIDAFVDGAATTLKVKEGSTAAKRLVTFKTDGDMLNTNTYIKLSDTEYLVALERITTNSDGYVTSVKLYDENALTQPAGADMDGAIVGTGIDEKTKDDVVTLHNANYAGTNADKHDADRIFTWSDDVVVAQYDDKTGKGNFNKSKMSSIKEDANDDYLAIMDDGVIIGLLTRYVDNDSNTNTGSDTVGDVSMDYEISDKGRLTMTVDYDRPAYIDETKAVTLTMYVYANGAEVAKNVSVTIPANKDSATVIVKDSGSNVEVEAGDKITISDVAISDAYVNVRYFNGDTQITDLKGTFDAYDTSVKVGATSVKFDLKSTASGNVNVGVTQGKVTLKQSASTAVSSTTGLNNLSAVGSGNYVDVKIDGLDSLKNTYTYTNSTTSNNTLEQYGSTTDKSMTLKVELSPAVSGSSLTAGDKYQVKATLSGTPNDAAAYEVTALGLTGTVSNNTAVTLGTITVNSDVTLSTKTVSVKAIDKTTATASWGDKTVTVKFNNAINSNSQSALKLWDYSANSTVSDCEVVWRSDGKTATITLLGGASFDSTKKYAVCTESNGSQLTDEYGQTINLSSNNAIADK